MSSPVVGHREECLPKPDGVIVGHEDLEAVLAGVAGAGQQQVESGAVDQERHFHRGVVLQPGDVCVLGRRDKPEQNVLRLGALDGDQRRFGRGVLHGDVEAGGAFPQGRGHHLGVACVRDHQVLGCSVRSCGEAVRDQVVDDAAVGVTDQRVLCLAHRHGRDLSDQGVVQECCGVRAGDPDFTHVGEVEQAGGVAHGVVFGELGAVLEGHLPAAEIGEGGASFLCSP